MSAAYLCPCSGKGAPTVNKDYGPTPGPLPGELDSLDPWATSTRLMPLTAFLSDWGLDDPDRIAGEEETHNSLGEARRVAAQLTESRARYVTWERVASYCERYTCLDQQLTHQLGDTKALAWLVFACCAEHQITVARHPDRNVWRCFRDLGLPQDYDLEALNEELLLDQILEEGRAGGSEPAPRTEVPPPAATGAGPDAADSSAAPDSAGDDDAELGPWLSSQEAAEYLGVPVATAAEVLDGVTSRSIVGEARFAARDLDDLLEPPGDRVGPVPDRHADLPHVEGRLVDVEQLAVLGVLIARGGELRRGELRRRCGLNKPEVRAALNSLEELGAIERQRKRIRLAPGFPGLLTSDPSPPAAKAI